MADDSGQFPGKQFQRLYDRSLVLRFQAGDDASFEEIVVEMYDRLRRFLVKSFRLNSADIDDLLQDVWVDACHGLRRLRQPESLRPWLYQVARNKALKHLGRRTNHASIEDLQIFTAPPSEESFSEMTQGDYQNALESLSDPHREVVILRYEEELSYDEIASAIECPVGTVRSRLFHAKRILQEKLRRFSNDDPD